MTAEDPVDFYVAVSGCSEVEARAYAEAEDESMYLMGIMPDVAHPERIDALSEEEIKAILPGDRVFDYDTVKRYIDTTRKKNPDLVPLGDDLISLMYALSFIFVIWVSNGEDPDPDTLTYAQEEADRYAAGRRG